MRVDSRQLENQRLSGLSLDNYPFYHERHRIFPAVFENRSHKRILDISAGIGVVARQIKEQYPCDLFCNEVSEVCLNELKKLNVPVTSYDLDTEGRIPFEDNSFDAIICLATLEHLINIDNFVQELNRILKEEGRLYLSVPNYAGWKSTLTILRGRSFHDPLHEPSRYEFYAHVRYFTYKTLLEYMAHFGFIADSTYLALPQSSSKIKRLRSKFPFIIPVLRALSGFTYLLSARWHEEPVICFAKSGQPVKHRKKIM